MLLSGVWILLLVCSLLIYKSAVEYEVRIHNMRKLLLSDLLLNAEKTLSWQDSHL